MESSRLTKALKAEAARLGFHLAGVCPARRLPGVERFRRWIASGKAAGMDYLAEQCRLREHPQNLLDGARSILMLGMSYRSVEPLPPAAGKAAVARYAWGHDYHDVIRERLRALQRFCEQLLPAATTRAVVDTAPLLEREFAQLAGLGRIGRNSMLINRRLGSYFFLAALLIDVPLTDAQLTADAPLEEDPCSSCRACVDACPSGALGEDGTVDARRCLSYLSVEHRRPIAAELREKLGNRLFGCDACQEACPWNRRAGASHAVETDPAFFPAVGMNPVDLAGLFALDEAGFRQRFRGTPLQRAKRRGILRGAAIVLGNQVFGGRNSPTFTQNATAMLAQGLGDREPLVRAACAWALGRCANAAAAAALRKRLELEDDEETVAEIRLALELCEKAFPQRPE